MGSGVGRGCSNASGLGALLGRGSGSRRPPQKCVGWVVRSMGMPDGSRRTHTFCLWFQGSFEHRSMRTAQIPSTACFPVSNPPIPSMSSCGRFRFPKPLGSRITTQHAPCLEDSIGCEKQHLHRCDGATPFRQLAC